MADFVVIEGARQFQLAVSAAAAQYGGVKGAVGVVPLEKGKYDVWCDIDVWIKVENIQNDAPDRAQDVTTATGYKIYAGNTVCVDIDTGRTIGAVAGGAGTLSLHKVA